MKIFVHPAERLSGTVFPPSSKNYTTRYIFVSCLAEGESVVKYPAESDDTSSLIECCEALGAKIRRQEDGSFLICGFGRRPQNPEVLNPHNAGAVLRFLLGVASLLPEVKFITDHPESLGKRPNKDLLDALAQLGVRFISNEGKLPTTLYGGDLKGGEITVSGATSSQYLSSLLFLAPLINKQLKIKVTDNLKSKPLIRITLEVLRETGISVFAKDDLLEFVIPAGQNYKPRIWEVNGDWPGAMAIISAAAVTNSDVKIPRLFCDEQGEREGIEVLRKMGVEINHSQNIVTVKGSGKLLSGGEFDGDLFTDAVLPLVGVACFADGENHFYNVENLRFKECDRITQPLRELRKIGVRCSETQSEIRIAGNPDGYEGGIEVEAHNDHRVIMLLTIVGLRCKKGLIINNAHHISKSFPHFFETLAQLGARFKEIK